MYIIDVYRLIKYENLKHEFFSSSEHQEMLDEKFSSHEENIYGIELCEIYKDLYEINYGKKYLKNNLIILSVAILSLLYNILFCELFKDNYIFILKPIFRNINIVIIIFLCLKLITIGKYYNFLLYKYIRLFKSQ